MLSNLGAWKSFLNMHMNKTITIFLEKTFDTAAYKFFLLNTYDYFCKTYKQIAPNQRHNILVSFSQRSTFLLIDFIFSDKKTTSF